MKTISKVGVKRKLKTPKLNGIGKAYSKLGEIREGGAKPPVKPKERKTKK